jgi:hypothetical protein
MMTDIHLATASDKASRSGLFEIWIGVPGPDYRWQSWRLDRVCCTSEETKKAVESDCRGESGDYAFDIRCPEAFRARHLKLASVRRERARKAYLTSKEFSEVPF